MDKRILFTGGGSAGHVTVNLALIPHFQNLDWDVSYIGSRSGIEADLIGKLSDVQYEGISTGKLRRYLRAENLKDPFRVVKGVLEAYRFIKRWKPDIVFSKGGFVSVPVVLAARMNRIPVIIHESDITPGLANRIAIPSASKVCVTFQEAMQHIPSGKAVHVGSIIRQDLLEGDPVQGRKFCGFTSRRPVLVCIGGSLGSAKINQALRSCLPELSSKFQIVHICGKGQLIDGYDIEGYRQYEYIHEELADVLAAADMVISRAGSNSIFEFLTLRKPMLLIPLSKAASRGDQILNAESFERAGYAQVLTEEELGRDTLLRAITQLSEEKSHVIERMKAHYNDRAITEVVELICEHAR